MFAHFEQNHVWLGTIIINLIENGANHTILTNKYTISTVEIQYKTGLINLLGTSYIKK